ncbi:MAG TPA: glycosyltransferase family 4 protein [Firmicutes bacterium]|nr:glycosyltransferase family 4 protein [Bacillota bacterium]
MLVGVVLLNLIAIGPVFEAVGYAEVNRNILLHLHRRGVNIKLIPKPLGVTSVELDAREQDLFARMINNSGRMANPVSLFVFIGAFFTPTPGSYSIGLTMLESDRIPASWVERCNGMDEIWVPSNFNYSTFRASGVLAEKVRVMHLGVDGARFRPGAPPLHIPGRRGFAFLSVFEWIPRKGYDLLIRAFLEEFRADEDVCLILKVHDNSSYDPDGVKIKGEIDHLRAQVGSGGPPIILISSILPPGAVPRLYAAADCFVLPTRGEGWNMPAIEAMACGLPVISTAWSAHLDFMNAGNSYLIDIEGLEPIPRFGIANDAVYSGAYWARPSIAHLKRLMRYVYENRDAARAVGMRASDYVREKFSWDRSVGRMYERLLEIQGQH